MSDAEARRPGKSPHFSVNWVLGNSDVEIIDATTGKRSCGGSSRLCKHTFSTRWARLYGKVTPAPFTSLGLGSGSGCSRTRAPALVTGKGQAKSRQLVTQDTKLGPRLFPFPRLPVDFTPGPQTGSIRAELGLQSQVEKWLIHEPLP